MRVISTEQELSDVAHQFQSYRYLCARPARRGHDRGLAGETLFEAASRSRSCTRPRLPSPPRLHAAVPPTFAMACRHDVSERPAGDGGRGVSGRHAGGGAPAAAARAGSAGGAALPAFLPAPPAARFHPAAGRPPQLAAAAPGGLRLCALPRRRAGPPAPSTGVLWMMAGGRGGGWRPRPRCGPRR